MISTCLTDRIECQNGHDEDTAQSVKETSPYWTRERINYPADYGLGC